MKKNSKHEDTAVTPQAGPDTALVLAKIQQQLASLEAKIDGLISKSSEKPFKDEHYTKSFQRFDRFPRHEKRGQGDSYRERVFTKAICANCHKECEVPFKPSGDRPVYCKDCFSQRKQGGPFKGEFDKGPGREAEPAQRQYSDKKPGRKRPGFGGKKPVSRRRKERA
jgi:CxxC-x17-CxxC domain-containing protein